MEVLQDFLLTFGSGDPEPSMKWVPGILGETFVLLILYRIIFFVGLKNYFQNVYSQRPWWEYVKSYDGIFSKDVQVEVCYISLLAVHHGIGGGLLLWGFLSNRPEIYAQGMIVELVDDIHDTTLMLFRLWPFNEPDPKLLLLMLPHHSFGFILVVPSLVMGWHLNEDCQAIGAALLMAGCISCIILVLNRTCDRRKPNEAILNAILFITNLSFYTWCRFYIFPLRLHNLYLSEWDKQTGTHQIAIASAILLLVFFNVAVWFDATASSIKAIGIAIQGGEKTDKKTK